MIVYNSVQSSWMLLRAWKRLRIKSRKPNWTPTHPADRSMNIPNVPSAFLHENVPAREIFLEEFNEMPNTTFIAVEGFQFATLDEAPALTEEINMLTNLLAISWIPCDRHVSRLVKSQLI